VSGVGKHHRAQVTGGCRGPDGFAVTLRDKKWEPAGMIYVRMGQYDSIDLSNGNRECSVLRGCIASLPLKHPAIEENSLSVYAKDMA
jgi:hypothetical protein